MLQLFSEEEVLFQLFSEEEVLFQLFSEEEVLFQLFSEEEVQKNIQIILDFLPQKQAISFCHF